MKKNTFFAVAVLALSTIGAPAAHAGLYWVGQHLKIPPLSVSDNEDLDGDGIVNHSDLDADGDLITNAYDSHPYDADSNQDGIIDGYEYNRKTREIATIDCAAAVYGNDPAQSHNVDLDGDKILNYADDYPCDPDVDHNGFLDSHQTPLGLCGHELGDNDGDWLVNRDDDDIDGDGIPNPVDVDPCDPDANQNGLKEVWRLVRQPSFRSAF